MAVNPWSQGAVDLMKQAVRAVIWICLSVCIVLISVFLIWFTFQFLWHTSTWMRTFFDGDWSS